jgi:hypothetical protein
VAFANPNVSDILATTIEHRSRKIADNVTANNALLARLKSKGKIRTFSGGHKIYEELSFAENANTGWYSGYDLLPIGVADVISAAEYSIKQCAVPVIISGLEQLQNAGKERMIDLLEARLKVAESSMANLISGGIYSDGLGAGGKQLDGLLKALPLDPTAASYAGIDGNVFAFWKNAVTNVSGTATLLADMNGLYAKTSRGSDQVDLIPCDNLFWLAYLAALQAKQQFTSAEKGEAGFTTIRFIGADVVLDGGIYPAGSITGATGAPASTAFFLNTNYIHFRPHASRNMVALPGGSKSAVNQDASVTTMVFAGNLTTSCRFLQGRMDIA